MKHPHVDFVRHVAFKVRDVEPSARYLESRWGLIPTGNETDHTDSAGFAGTLDSRPLVKLSEGPAKGIDHVSFAARDEAAVDAMATRVQRLGLHLVREPGPDEDGIYGMRCRDAAGLQVEVALTNPTPTNGTPSAAPIPDRPMLISHVVINTPDLEETSALYCELFGFEISDRYGDFMTFLRCNRFHHSLAFSQAAHTSLNHVAFEMGSIDAVMRGTSRLQNEGQGAIWGPGRHGPGDNVFAYFLDPNGLLMEYTSGLEIFDEADPRAAKVWAIGEPESENLWGTGDPSDDAAEAMWGQPDPYLRPAG